MAGIQGLCTLLRRERFCASHGGAGGGVEAANFTLEVGLRGGADPATGMVLNIQEVGRIVRERVTEALDHEHLDRLIPSGGGSPTPERIARWIWSRLEGGFPRGELSLLRLQPDEEREIEIRKEANETMRLTRSYRFCAAHRLEDPRLSPEENRALYGKCFNPHGHTFVLEVTVKGAPSEPAGLLLDPALLDRIVEEEVLARYDHRSLNEIPGEFEAAPTAERLVRRIWERIAPRLLGPALDRIILRETPNNAFEYGGE